MQRAHYPRSISNKTGMSHEILVRPPILNLMKIVSAGIKRADEETDGYM
jgi:hypothetical protein